MSRVSWALAIGFFIGLGAHLSLAQPIDLSSGKFRNLTVTNSLAVGNDLTVADDLTVTDTTRSATVHAAYVDGGVLNVSRIEFVRNNIFGPTLYSHPDAPGVIQLDGGLSVAGPVNFRNSQTVSCGTSGAQLASLDCSSGAVSFGDTNVTGDFTLSSVKAITNTTPTVTACSGGSAAAMAWTNGSALFEFDVGTSCAGESTAVITLEAVAHGYTCKCWNVSATTNLVQTAGNTTTVTITNMGTSVATPANWTDGHNVQCLCMGG